MKYTINEVVRRDCLDVISRVDLTPLRGKRILLTGANGFLGQYIAQLIFVANEELNLKTTLFCTSWHDPIHPLRLLCSKRSIHWRSLDLTESTIDLWPGIKFDYIFHAACPGQPAKFVANPLRTIALNTVVTQKLLERAKKDGARFVFFSSADIYGEMPKGVRQVNENYHGDCPTLNIRAVYRESKRMGETICFLFNQEYSTNVVILRILALYGPGVSIHDTRVLGNFIRGALVDGKIIMLDQGKSQKAFGYVADAMAMIMFAAIRGQELVYNVGGTHFITVRKLAQLVSEYCGVPYKVPQEDAQLQYVGGDPRALRVDLTRILAEMGDDFSFTPLKIGLARAIEWNKAEFLNARS